MRGHESDNKIAINFGIWNVLDNISIEIGKAGRVKVSALDPDKVAFGKAVRMTSDGTLAFEGLGLNKWEEKVFVIK